MASCYRALGERGRENATTPKEGRKAIKSQRRSKNLKALSTGSALREH